MIACSLSTVAYAEPGACTKELTQLVVPPLQHVFMKKSDIQTELSDNSAGVYSVRLFVAADSPDNLDKQVSIGWVNLDTHSMRAYDITRDPDHPEILNVSEKLYRDYVSKCLPIDKTADVNCDQLNDVAEHSGVLIDKSKAGMTVYGAGRLQFYSAPSIACKINGVFILTGESVEANSKYKGFTSIVYLNATTNKSVNGWVYTDRLQPAVVGIAPN